jgi:hypothetical protein
MDLPYSSGASVDLLGEEGIGEYGVRAVRGVATNQGFYRWLSRFSEGVVRRMKGEDLGGRVMQQAIELGLTNGELIRVKDPKNAKRENIQLG